MLRKSKIQYTPFSQQYDFKFTLSDVSTKHLNIYCLKYKKA